MSAEGVLKNLKYNCLRFAKNHENDTFADVSLPVLCIAFEWNAKILWNSSKYLCVFVFLTQERAEGWIGAAAEEHPAEGAREEDRLETDAGEKERVIGEGVGEGVGELKATLRERQGAGGEGGEETR